VNPKERRSDMVNAKTMTDDRRSTHAIPGVIKADDLYRADELMARMGWRRAAFRAACRRGLRTLRVGKRLFIAGSDVLEFVQRTGGAE
jgi:hypothetical protein